MPHYTLTLTGRETLIASACILVAGLLIGRLL